MLHKEVLSSVQLNALQVFPDIEKDYFLIGGTAIALYLGHRKSIDFYFFTNKYPIQKNNIFRIFQKNGMEIVARQVDESQEYSFITSDTVKWTFFSYPFRLSNLLCLRA